MYGTEQFFAKVINRHLQETWSFGSQVKSSQVKSRHVTSRPVPSRPVASRRVTSRHVTSRHVKSRHVTSSQVKSSQVSPNARRRAQCKGGGGKEKYRYTRNCTTYRRLSENVVLTFTWNRNPGNMEAKHPIWPHFLQQFPNCPKVLYLQNMSNLISVPSLLWASNWKNTW